MMLSLGMGSWRTVRKQLEEMGRCRFAHVICRTQDLCQGLWDADDNVALHHQGVGWASWEVVERKQYVSGPPVFLDLKKTRNRVKKLGTWKMIWTQHLKKGCKTQGKLDAGEEDCVMTRLASGGLGASKAPCSPISAHPLGKQSFAGNKSSRLSRPGLQKILRIILDATGRQEGGTEWGNLQLHRLWDKHAPGVGRPRGRMTVIGRTRKTAGGGQ